MAAKPTIRPLRNKPFFSPSFAAGVTEACSSVVVSSSLFSSINALLYFQDIVATRRVSCRNTHFSVLRTLEMLHTFAFRAIGASPHWFVATRISPCSALPKCCIHSHSGLSTLLHIGLSQHAFLRAPHSRNAAYIRIPGYRPTCSCMFVLLIARALCLQAVTCPAITELLRQVVPGGCVSSILTHAEVQMVAGGTSGGAHCGYRLSSGHNIVLGYI